MAINMPQQSNKIVTTPRLIALLKDGPLLNELCVVASSQHHHQPITVHPRKKLIRYKPYLFFFVLHHSEGKR